MTTDVRIHEAARPDIRELEGQAAPEEVQRLLREVMDFVEKLTVPSPHPDATFVFDYSPKLRVYFVLRKRTDDLGQVHRTATIFRLETLSPPTN